MIDRHGVTTERLCVLAADFDRYVIVYDQVAPFKGEKLASHCETITLRRRAGSLQAAVADDVFVSRLRQTLIAWRNGSRRSELVDKDTFAAALRAAAPGLAELEALTIDSRTAPMR
jgi:hypothetical protein